MARSQSDPPTQAIEKLLEKANNEAFQPAAQAPMIDLSSVDVMTADDLRVLAKRMACQCGLVASMTQEQTAQAMLDRMAEIALRPIVPGVRMMAQVKDCIGAINGWLDRVEGKPMQRIKQDTTVSFDLKANSALLNRFKDRLGVKEQIVIEGTTGSGEYTDP